MTLEEVNNFEKLQSQLQGLHNEISALSKKSHNDALNKFKLKFINQILSECNELLGNDYKPFDDFDLFDENDMPSNSDAAMMLTQYLNCFEKLRGDNIRQQSKYPAHWCWMIDGSFSDIRTIPPKTIKDK
ncbi:hypothetical protein [uncultured Imperialibacter sp.]|uniref:hypothetical protein n=1 Tax=uncultured Imperialibacter sp. TaxID=1672639 RepID=UPI0030D8CDFC|tara:strand:+ start:1900 stop:2289 length:390 start_codon:yes stop_codon:yes gene_type:complete